MVESFAAALFLIGLLGIVLRRTILVMLMSLELMLNAVNLTFVAFGQQQGLLTGQVYVFFTMTIAAAEAAIGLALVIALFRTFRSVDTHAVHGMRE